MNSHVTGSFADASRRAVGPNTQVKVEKSGYSEVRTVLCYLLSDTSTTDLEDDFAERRSASPVLESSFSFAHTCFVSLSDPISSAGAKDVDTVL